MWTTTAMIAVTVCLITAIAAGQERSGSGSEELSPEHALQQLLDGNNRYVNRTPAHPDSLPSDAPQHPVAVILSCSDSRVPPELIFDQGVGKLFVVRVAGNTYDRLALESIEYAVAQLGARLLLVIGHDQCGAVAAALKAYPAPKGGPMIANIYPAVREVQGKPGDKLSNAVDANALLTARRLGSEPALSSAVKAGTLEILAARYSLATGKVRILRSE